MADPYDPQSAASTFAKDQPGRGVVSDDADAKGQNPRSFETETEAQHADGVEGDVTATNYGEAAPIDTDDDGDEE